MPSDPAVSSLCLSVDWAQDASGKIAASDSQGCLTVLAAQQMKPVRLWKAHSDEAWIAAFCQNSNLVLSGRVVLTSNDISSNVTY